MTLTLVVLDGFGIGDDPDRNALMAARMPTWDRLTREWPMARLEASGEAVGLPAGQMGNSEVGHLNLGAGFRGAAGPAANHARHRRRHVSPYARAGRGMPDRGAAGEPRCT